MKKNLVCAIIIKDDKVFCCKSGIFEGKWAFPYSDTPLKSFLGDEYERALEGAVIGDLKMERGLVGSSEDKIRRIELHARICRSDSGKFQLVDDRERKWLTAEELYTVDWEPLCEPFVLNLKKMLSKQQYRIFVVYKDGTEETIWSGICSEVEQDRKFYKAIQDQASKYAADKRSCKVCAHNKDGEILSWETFH